MFTLLVVVSCVVAAGLAAVGLLLSAEDRGSEPAGPSPSNKGLSDLSRVEFR
jgi:hypothetical protein